MDRKMKTIIAAADLISGNDVESAKSLISAEYPHVFIQYDKRRLSAFEKLKIYVRDGFVDQYDGSRLVFPNVLRILSSKLGNTFPYHPNWKMSDCHIAYWELLPTCDHIVPIARGGVDDEKNIVTTSMKNNSSKLNFLPEEVGFVLRNKGNLPRWDGLVGWYKSYIRENPIDLDGSMKEWDEALVRYERENGEFKEASS